MPFFHLALGELTVTVFLNEVGRKVRQMFQEGSPTRSYGYHWMIMQIPLDYMGALGNNFTQPHSQGTYSLTLNIDKEVRTIMSDGC